MYDEKHRFFVLSTDANTKERILYKGFRQRLFCGDCEKHMNREFETYTANLFLQSSRFGFKEHKVGKFTIGEFTGLDYKKLKLFLISLLWRLSLVVDVKFVDPINLGPHQERMRKMILNSDPGPYWKYGCITASVKILGNKDMMFFQDIRAYTDGHHIYRFLISGLHFSFHVANHKSDSKILSLFLQDDGTWPILKLDHTDIPYLSLAINSYINTYQKRRI